MTKTRSTNIVTMDGNEDTIFNTVGLTDTYFEGKIMAKELASGDSLRIRVYNRNDGVSYYPFDSDVNDYCGSNNGTITYHTNLKRFYKFESNLNDSTGTANGTLAAGTATYVTGQEGTAFSFDGSSYITASDTGLPTGTNVISFSGWINPTSFSVGPAFFEYGTGVGTAFSLSFGTGGLIDFYNGSTATAISTSTLNLSTWTFVTVTYDGTNARVYLNGVLDKTTAITVNTSLGGGTALSLGAFSNGNQKLTGKMDEVRVYNITLTQAQVSALYMVGKFGQSHTFDGGEYITKTSPVGIPTGSSDRSVSFWINLPAFPSVRGSCLVYGTAVANQAFGVFIDNTGHVVAEGYANDTTSNTVLTLGVWNHIVVTLSISGTVKTIYINGVQDKQATQTALNTSSGTLYIGFDGVDNLGANIAQIDELRIYNRALSSADVTDLYNNPAPMKSVLYDKSYSGPLSPTTCIYVPYITSNQYTLTAQQTTSTYYKSINGELYSVT